MKIKTCLSKVVFLDRDGVINHDSPDYIKSCAEFEFIPGSVEAIKRLNDQGFQIIVITNQSVIGRKMISRETLDQIFGKMFAGVQAGGGIITDIFYCPHHPADACDCRKPKPGLIQRAAQKYAIPLEKAYMVGDSVKDIECARNAGCGQAILVKTGNGASAEVELARQKKPADHVAPNLAAAVRWIIASTENAHTATFSEGSGPC